MQVPVPLYNTKTCSRFIASSNIVLTSFRILCFSRFLGTTTPRYTPTDIATAPTATPIIIRYGIRSSQENPGGNGMTSISVIVFWAEV